LFFLYLNIISNISDPSNHSQTLRKFTLNPPSFTFNPLKVTTKTSHSNPLEFMIPSHSNQPRQWVMGRKIEIPQFLTHICYAMIWGW